jgi:hypothetical protein
MGNARDALHAKRSQANPRDTHIKSAYVTFMKAQIDLPEIRIQIVQNPTVFIAVAIRQESNRYKDVEKMVQGRNTLGSSFDEFA